MDGWRHGGWRKAAALCGLIGFAAWAGALACNGGGERREPPDSGSDGLLPPAVYDDAGLQERPLSDLAPDAQGYLEGRAGDWGVAVVVPSEEKVYTSNPDQQLEMASVTKVLIMLTLLYEHASIGTPLSDAEAELMRKMIVESDNDAADILWEEVGRAEGVGAYLNEIGVDGFTLYTGAEWGESLGSARAVARVMAGLAFNSILPEGDRLIALRLLENVEAQQRWGVSNGVREQESGGCAVGIKDGWYPATDGWRVNSAGYVLAAEKNGYSIVVMTRGQVSFEYGVETIEGAAGMINEALQAVCP